MNSLLAKFKVGSVTDFGNDNIEVKMTPVVSGSEENKSFSLYTPSGDCRLHITNPSAKHFFKVSKEYYLTFQPQEEAKSYTLYDNSDAIRVFLNEETIEWAASGHCTIIYGEQDLFELGRKFERYARLNNPAYK